MITIKQRRHCDIYLKCEFFFQLGKSKEGKVLQFVTNGEKPGGSPRNVRLTALSPTSLELTWDDPEKRLLHGPVVRYNIGYREYK